MKDLLSNPLFWRLVPLGTLALAVAFAFLHRHDVGPLQRWGHSGVWVLLTVAALLRTVSPSAARLAALVAGLLYLAFLAGRLRA